MDLVADPGLPQGRDEEGHRTLRAVQVYGVSDEAFGSFRLPDKPRDESHLPRHRLRREGGDYHRQLDQLRSEVNNFEK